MNAKELWRPKDPKSTRTWEFMSLIENKYGIKFDDYEALRRWSITNLDAFWSEVWRFTGIRTSQPFTRALEDDRTMFPRPIFFPGALLNFAENLLHPASDPAADSLALSAATETSREHVTWAQLRERVRRCTNALKAAGVREGDRVAGYTSHHANTVVAMLGATAIGALWTGVSPDTGAPATLDRLQQIAPAILFCDNATFYNGKIHATRDKVVEIIRSLPSELKTVVVFDTVPGHAFDTREIQHAQSFAGFLAAADSSAPQTFAQLPADHPIYILYSSGTTGRPKCIVHGAIGTLIEHKKEHEIQASLRPGERLFYYTTTSWMMWHWQVSGLASGLTLVLYDGSPFRPLDPASGSGALAMSRLIDELHINHFGTSAKYLSVLEQQALQPRAHGCHFSTLRTIFSTGSPLAPSTFAYVYAAFRSGPGRDLLLASITGGTDIVAVFAGPAATCPVHRGEIQARGLGFALEAWDAKGHDVTMTGAAGDLVCTKPFPCQPVAFWGKDGDDKYRASYFETFPGVWRHGDFVRFNPKTGGVVMLGRSDGVLKPAGVRFGSAEIYNVLTSHFPEVADALCIGRRRESDVDETVVLFLQMAPDKTCDDGLVERVKGAVRKSLSARHVPSIIEACPEIPVTTNGKKVEVAVKQILCGLDLQISASVANKECLEWFREWHRTHP